MADCPHNMGVIMADMSTMFCAGCKTAFNHIKIATLTGLLLRAHLYVCKDGSEDASRLSDEIRQALK